ncbi:MAG: 4Fe-4S binding protein [Myxococcales bacterium]|jgi:polyferredoxin
MDQQGQNGLLSTYRHGWRSRNAMGMVIATLLVLFYVVLYWEDHARSLLGFAPFTELAEAVGLRNRWYLYGLLYSVAMTGGAIYYLRHHGNSRYNRVRIGVNVSVQVLLAFLLPFVMPLFGGTEFYFSYFWPLKYDYFYPQTLGQLPLYMALYTLVGSLVLAPILAVVLGKRWYCSWVCGCGGLANTFGDPWRHLTSKSTKAWRFEQAAVHSVLGIIILVTFLLGLDSLIGADHPTFSHIVSGPQAWSLKTLYGFVVGAVLAGVVGVGFYPLFGPRVWCRNFCPMAAALGLMQKLGRFRIRVKPDMCISCGNCSTYCEMGIDVRSYAQANQSFTRASCVGCGMCAHMCPRGVLKLESSWRHSDDKERQRLSVVDF